MRRVRLTPEARDRLAEQLDYLISRGAIAPAQGLKARTDIFLNRTLAHIRAPGGFYTNAICGRFGFLGHVWSRGTGSLRTRWW
jgi:hypothetical protein